MKRQLVVLSLVIGSVAAVAFRSSAAGAADWPQFMRSAEHTGDAANQVLQLPLKLIVSVQLGDAVTTSPARDTSRARWAVRIASRCLFHWRSSSGRASRPLPVLHVEVAEAGKAATVASGHVVAQVHGGSCDHEIVGSQGLAPGR